MLISFFFALYSLPIGSVQPEGDLARRELILFKCWDLSVAYSMGEEADLSPLAIVVTPIQSTLSVCHSKRIK